MWLSGFLSDMASTKALALADWARGQGLPMLRFDYSGHGRSEGDLMQASIGDWLEEASAMLGLVAAKRRVDPGRLVAWAAGWRCCWPASSRKRAALERLAGLVLIAPAWDMTERLMWNRISAEAQSHHRTRRRLSTSRRNMASPIRSPDL